MTHHFRPIDNHRSVGRHGHNRHTKVHSQGVDVCYNRKNPKVKITLSILQHYCNNKNL